MEKLILNGGRPLSGSAQVGGSKNAALPLIFATVLTEEPCIIENLPAIRDVEMSLAILRSMGASIRAREGGVEICTKNMRAERPPEGAVRSLRASTYLLGAMLGRFGQAFVQDFGGCNFSPRPIDMHLSAALSLGASLEEDRLLAPKGLRAAVIPFDKVSVGATVNALLMAVSAKGVTVIENAACEPHVENLVAFLRSMGARIRRIGSALVVEGVPLHGGHIRTVGDMIEGGTYLLCALATGGRVEVKGLETEHLSSLLSLLSEGGAEVKRENASVTVGGALCRPLSFTTAPYPAFPTDLQPQTALIGGLFEGAAVREGVFPGRFGYLRALEAMGLSYVKSQSAAYILPSRLHAARVEAEDLRGGAALLLAALHAEGRSEIGGARFLLRGYERIVEKLSSLGADIQLVKDETK